MSTDGSHSRRRHRWLLLALGLLTSAYLLTGTATFTETRKTSHERPAFPRAYEDQHVERLKKHLTLPPAPSAADATAPPIAVVSKRDPLLVALPPDASSIVVFEAKALYDTPAAKMLIACMGEQGELDELEASGLSLTDFDRVAVAESSDGTPVMVLTGAVAAHDAGFMTREGSGPRFVRAWRGELLVAAETQAAVDEAIDRLEGRRVEPQAISERESYGDIYGKISRDDLKRMMRGSVPEAAWQGGVDLGFHVDANRDVLMVLEAEGAPGTTQDLGKAFGAAIAARRVQAVMQDEHELAELLDYFEVDMAHDGFSIDAALPLSFVEEMMGECAREARKEHGRARPATGGAAGAPAAPSRD